MRDGTEDPDWPIWDDAVTDDEPGGAAGLTGAWPTEEWLAGDPPSGDTTGRGTGGARGARGAASSRAGYGRKSTRQAYLEAFGPGAAGSRRSGPDSSEAGGPDPADMAAPGAGRGRSGRASSGRSGSSRSSSSPSDLGRGGSGRGGYGRIDPDALDSDLRGYRGPGSGWAERDLDTIYPDARDVDLVDPDEMALDGLGLDDADVADLATAGPDAGSLGPADPGAAGIRRARSRWKGADAAEPDEWFGGEEAARAACLRLLTTAPRTRAQLATALRRRRVPEQIAESVLARFTEVGLIDDAAFARAWVESRHHSKGLARRVLAAELRQRGVPAGEVREAVGSLGAQDEIEAARQLVGKRLPASRGRPLPTRARQLLGMLARKGYPAGLAAQVVREALEQEETGNPDLALISEDTTGEGWL